MTERTKWDYNTPTTKLGEPFDLSGGEETHQIDNGGDALLRSTGNLENTPKIITR